MDVIENQRKRTLKTRSFPSYPHGWFGFLGYSFYYHKRIKDKNMILSDHI